MADVLQSLKLMLYNTENLFLLSDQKLSAEHTKLDENQWQKLSTSIYENKPILKTKHIAKIILDESPDIVMLCEVGGLESLQNFNRLFLNEGYHCALMEGNSDRNIDVGFLIKKSLPFYFDLMSNKNRSINYLYPHERQSVDTKYPDKVKTTQSHRFSRDAAELHLFTNNREKPFLIILLAHLKSRLDPAGVDPNGFERRQAELKTLIEIYKELLAKKNCPMIVAGDFNGNASHTATDKEFQPLYDETELADVLRIAQLTLDKSATYYQVGRNQSIEGRQIDYCFLSKELAPYLDKKSAFVYRYKDYQGLESDPPKTMDQKLNFPSDHYPIFFNLIQLPTK